MRYGGKQTLYDVLDLPRGVTSREVENAYRRIKAQMEKDPEPPDARRLALVSEAFEVLADDNRRAAYDASLLADRVVAAEPRGVPLRWIAIAAAATMLAIAAIVALRPRGPAATPRDAIAEQAGVAVARLLAIDVGGARRAIALATTVEEGTMATTCRGLTPGVQLLVNNGTLTLAATVAIADTALDVCRLSVPSGASRPPAQNTALPRVGDRLYVASAKADGVALQEAAVSMIVPGTSGSLIGIDRPVAPDASGGGVFDANGKLVGIATSARPPDRAAGLVIPMTSVAAARSRGR
jgi:hypothetical protein